MFWTFPQINSGGRFRPPAIFVIVEANSIYEANHRAEHEIGLYWDGAFKGRDCQCCGDRWNKLDEDSVGMENPHDNDGNVFFYGLPYDGKIRKMWAKEDKVPYAIIYYLDGTTASLD